MNQDAARGLPGRWGILSGPPAVLAFILPVPAGLCKGKGLTEGGKGGIMTAESLWEDCAWGRNYS